ncbi:MAG: hypothetical protein JWP94_1681 [Mucilaginibacter sp.]|jgi:hypothetical protein|nr:hypothetical protein [Mucilaginibacter sp.]
MKKISITLIAVIVLMQFGHAQWTTSGSNIYNTNTGNVGIGTTTPSQKLVVIGNANVIGQLRADLGATGTSLVVTGSGSNFQIGHNGTSHVQVFNSSGGAIQFNNYLNAVTLFHIDGGGNVGIGTTTPVDIFEVSKSSTAKFKIFTPTSYTYPTDFNTGVIGLGLSRSDGVYTAGIYSYTSASSNDNVGIGSRSDIVFLSGNGALGQQPEAMRIKSNGNVGIGTTSPGYKLDITSSASGANANGLRVNQTDLTVGVTHSSAFATQQLGSGTARTLLYAASNTTGITQGELDIVTENGGSFLAQLGYNTTGSSNSLNLYNGSTSAIRLNTNGNSYINGGNVGIGTTDPGTYMLAVNGSVHARQVNVDMTGWSDYVFNRNYLLPSLTSIKAYIDQNHHLPDMPSEQQIIKDGLNLGEMNKLLVKKIEELTLYLIQEDNKDNEQSVQLKYQQEQINKLQEQLNQLIKISGK